MGTGNALKKRDRNALEKLAHAQGQSRHDWRRTARQPTTRVPVRSRDNVPVFPVGAGLSVRLGQLTLDLRAVYRRTAFAEMFSDLSSAGAWLRAGFEY